MDRNIILRIFILFCCLLHSSADLIKNSRCQMGYMTEVQSWVDELGGLHPAQADIENTIDLSTRVNPMPTLHQRLSLFRTPSEKAKYLSLARCQLTRVPPIFQIRDNQGRQLSSTLEYLTFYGNAFLSSSSTSEQYTTLFNATGIQEINLQTRQMHVRTLWSTSLKEVYFPNLRELDLRACAIQFLGENTFNGMPNLEALYIGENEIRFIEAAAFAGLRNLLYLDFSRNKAYDEHANLRILASEENDALKYLKKLVSLDLSYTKLTQRNLGLMRSLGKSLRSLSLCETGLNILMQGNFNNTSLELLDVSYNSGILNTLQALEGIEQTLEMLYAREIGLSTMDIFYKFSRLEILQLSYNEINTVTHAVAETLSSLQILDLNNNRVTSWFGPKYSLMPKLKYLSLKDNNLNVITKEMIEDVMDIDFLALSGNFIVCNCHVKDLYKMAAINEKMHNDTLLQVPGNEFHHNGHLFFNRIIEERLPVQFECNKECMNDIGSTGKFRLVDYRPRIYVCLMVPDSTTVYISNVTSCRKSLRDNNYEQELAGGKRKLLALLALPCILVPVALIYLFRRHFRYFFITIRNSAMLSLIDKKDVVDDNTIFNYDVFVSYCNEDRGWVLDHLLPHIEAECSVSVCLHERDFQVGLSILENIVSCMDRSRSIMLIISQKFLLSQWCQFEMHLAQHRLLETRREDLTLVLLEDIPRRLRPNTLHYLMLTKTYIVWPKEQSERHIFWRRLKKTLISRKNKQAENVSLA